MGRFTSVQTFSDAKTKVVSAAGIYGPGAGGGGGGGAGGGAEGEGAVQAGGKISGGSARVSTENSVHNVSGSAAGANSSEFHIFRNARRREMDRWEDIEGRAKREEEQREYASKVERNKAEAEQRTKKNAEKRKKKKEKQLMKKKEGKGGDLKDGALSDMEDSDKNEEDQSSSSSSSVPTSGTKRSSLEVEDKDKCSTQPLQKRHLPSLHVKDEDD